MVSSEMYYLKSGETKKNDNPGTSRKFLMCVLKILCIWKMFSLTKRGSARMDQTADNC